MKRILSILICALLLCTLLPISVLAANDTTASSMQLAKCEGTVTVKNASGKKLDFQENMRLYNNYQITTGRKSYAYITLDNSKAIKLDASSKITISRNGRKLEILVEKGKLLFDVSEPLKNDETLNIRTSTMITGVRGTIGWVEIAGSNESHLCLLEGSTLVTALKPSGTTAQTTRVEAGQTLSASTIVEDDSVEVQVNELKEEETPGFVRVAIAENPQIQQRIEENTTLKVDELTKDAAQTLQQEEQITEEKSGEIQKELDKVVIETVDPLFEDTGSSKPEPIPAPVPTPVPTPTKHTVNFNINGHGNSVASQTITHGGKVTEPTTPSVEGYVFGGWFTDEKFTTAWSFDTDTVTKNLTLYAKWTANAYTVAFELYDLGDAIDSQTVEHSKTVAKPEDPVANGYTFGGWFKDEKFLDEWDFETDTVTADTTIYAKWTLISYTVSFEMNGHGDAIESQTVDHGNAVSKPTDPVADGYEFGGWFKDAELTIAWDFETDTITKNLTLYAKWTINSYTVNFNTNGHGDAVESQTIDHGGKVTEPTAPSVEGYVFGGWFTDAECTIEWNFDSDTVTKNLTLFAKWTTNSYTVNFEMNGHGDAVESQAIDHGGLVTEPTAPSVEGYIFGGWFTDAECTIEWNFDSDTVTENLTLFAKWTVISYTVSFEMNGHGDAIESQTVDHGNAVSKPTYPVADGYEFGGWFKDAELTIAWDFETDTITKNLTLFAKWTIISYTVSFETNGHGDAIESQTINHSEKVTKPTDPSAEGYTFGGWFTDAECTIEWNFDSDTVTENITLFAKWTVISYTVNFEMNGHGDAVESQTINHSEKVTKPTDPSAEGYTFGGWFTDAECTTAWNFDSDTVTANTTLFAKWTVNQYTITFMDGDTKLHSITLDFGAAITVPEDPAKEGYQFAGWDTEIPTTMPAEDLIINATWTINTYTVNFNTNGHGDAIESQTINHSEKVTKPTDPSAEGYTFGGWFTDAECTTAWNFDSDTVTANTTLFAKWTVNQYTITFMDGDTELHSITLDFGAAITVPEDPAKEGYQFAGWDTEIPTTMPAEDLIINATWTINSYTVSFEMNGHGDAVESQTINHGSKVTEPTAPSVDGYTFGGWFTDAECTIEWNFDTDTVTKNLTLYAKWMIISYTVNFEMNGHGDAIESQTIDHGNAVSKPTDPVADGYEFGGWFKDAELTIAWDFETDTVTKVTTLFAKWTEIPSVTELDNPSAEEFAAALEAAGQSDYITEVSVTNAAIALDSMTVYEGDTLTLNSGSLTLSGITTVSGTVNIASDATLVNNGTMSILSSESLHISGHFTNNADLMIGGAGKDGTVTAGAVTVEENGTLESTGTIVVDPDTDSTLTNNGTIINSGEFTVTAAGQFTNNGSYEENRDVIVAMSSSDTSVLYLMPLSKMTEWPSEAITLIGAESETLNTALPAIESADVILDLNGRTITTGSGIQITENASLILRDSSDGASGKIVASYSFAINNSGTFTLESGTVESVSSAAIQFNSDSSTYINGGSVTGTSYGIYGGTTTNTINTLTVTDGYIYGSNYGIYTSYSQGPVLISGGEIVSDKVALHSNGVYAEADNTGTRITAAAILRVTGENADTASPALITGGATIEGGKLYAKDPTVFDALQMQLPQETGPDEDGYYCVDMSADPSIWTLNDPTEDDVLRVLNKEYVTELTLTNVDISAVQDWTIPTQMKVIIESGTLVTNGRLVIFGELHTGAGTSLTANSSVLINQTSALWNIGGAVTLNGSLNLDNGDITIAEGASLTATENAGFVFSGDGDFTINNYGTFTSSCGLSVTRPGTFYNYGTFTDNRTNAISAYSANGAAVNYIGQFSNLPAWYDGDTVTLHGAENTIGFFPSELTLVSGVSVTLDLNGRKLEMSTITDPNDGAQTVVFLSIQPGASFTLTDSSTGKTGFVTSDGSSMIYNYGTLTINGANVESQGAESYASVITNDGTFILDGGSITGACTYIVSNTGSFTMVNATVTSTGGEAAVANNGTLTMEGGSITQSTDGCGIYTQPYSTTTINGGTVSGGTYGLSIKGMSGDSSVININGGTISGASAGIDKVGGGGSLTITDGEITSDDTAVKAGGAEVYISGGTFDGKNAALYASSNTTITGGIFTSGAAAVIAESNYGVLNISGGTFEGTNAALSISEPTTKAIITGGTFTSDSTVIIANGAYGEYTDPDYPDSTSITGTLITGSTTLRLTAAEMNDSTALISGDSTFEGGTLYAKSTEFFTLLKLEVPESAVPDTDGYYTLTIAAGVADVSTLEAFVEALNNRTHTINVTSANWTLSATDTVSVLTIPESVIVNFNSGSIVIDAGYELYVDGILNMAAGTSITNNGVLAIGSSGYPTADLVNNGGTLTNNGAYLDYRYQNASNTTNSYLVVDIIDADWSASTVYCGAPEGLIWENLEGYGLTITYHVFSNDEAPLYIPDTFSGTADEPFSLQIDVESHTNTPGTLVITTESGQLTVENTQLSFNKSTYTGNGTPTIQFNGHINLNSGSSLEATDTAFTGIDESLAVITNDGSESTGDYTVMLRGCTLTQNGSVSALDLTNASVRLEGIDNNSYSAIIPTTITSGGAGIVVSTSVDFYSHFEATNAVIFAQDTGLEIGTSATVTLSGCTVTSENGTAIRNQGELTLNNSCTVSGATYALYNEGSVFSEASEDYDLGGYIYNTFILTSADGFYTVFSQVEEGSDMSVSLYGTFKAKNNTQIFSEEVSLDTDEVTEEYSSDQSTILYYVIYREYAG